MKTLVRNRKTKDPCEGCGLHRDRCLCNEIPKIKTRTKISLIIHAKELKRTTNTGQLALKALVNSEMFTRGAADHPLDFSEILDPNYRTFLFYPSDDAFELNAELVSKSEMPIQLLVPDGNWRQAGKVHYRYKEIAHIPRIKISAPNLATHHLRKESSIEGMSTLQAIAFAIGVIEGREAGDQLMKLYDLKLRRTLEGRGR